MDSDFNSYPSGIKFLICDFPRLVEFYSRANQSWRITRTIAFHKASPYLCPLLLISTKALSTAQEQQYCIIDKYMLFHPQFHSTESHTQSCLTLQTLQQNTLTAKQQKNKSQNAGEV